MFAYDWIAFFVTFFSTMFLVGELLVRMKGVFALLGIGFITVYFYSYLEPDMFFLMGAMYVLGLTLLIIDGKFVQDGTLGTIGAVIMVLSVSLSAPSWEAGLYSASGVVLGGFSSLIFLKVFPKRQVWGKVTLKDQLSSEMGYNSMNEAYKSLIGKRPKLLRICVLQVRLRWMMRNTVRLQMESGSKKEMQLRWNTLMGRGFS